MANESISDVVASVQQGITSAVVLKDFTTSHYSVLPVQIEAGLHEGADAVHVRVTSPFSAPQFMDYVREMGYGFEGAQMYVLTDDETEFLAGDTVDVLTSNELELLRAIEIRGTRANIQWTAADGDFGPVVSLDIPTGESAQPPAEAAKVFAAMMVMATEEARAQTKDITKCLQGFELWPNPARSQLSQISQARAQQDNQPSIGDGFGR